MTEYSQASQWVPSGLELDEKANVHRMLHQDHPLFVTHYQTTVTFGFIFPIKEKPKKLSDF